jgi:hypothetical protein
VRVGPPIIASRYTYWQDEAEPDEGFHAAPSNHLASLGLLERRHGRYHQGARTHTAFALKREGKKFGRWLEIGGARTEQDGSIRVFLDRTPIGGFNGYVYLCPVGTEPAATSATEAATAGERRRRGRRGFCRVTAPPPQLVTAPERGSCDASSSALRRVSR